MNLSFLFDIHTDIINFTEVSSLPHIHIHVYVFVYSLRVVSNKGLHHMVGNVYAYIHMYIHVSICAWAGNARFKLVHSCHVSIGHVCWIMTCAGEGGFE